MGPVFCCQQQKSHFYIDLVMCIGIFIVVHVDCLAQLCQIILLISVGRFQVPLHFVRRPWLHILV